MINWYNIKTTKLHIIKDTLTQACFHEHNNNIILDEKKYVYNFINEYAYDTRLQFSWIFRYIYHAHNAILFFYRVHVTFAMSRYRSTPVYGQL